MMNDISKMSTALLAYLGDASYEIYIRRMLIERGGRVDKMHVKAIKYVSADGQALAVKTMLKSEFLTDDEIRLVKRARNKKITSHPRGADNRSYKLATGLEALLGYLELEGDRERLQNIAAEAVRIIDERNKVRKDKAIVDRESKLGRTI